MKLLAPCFLALAGVLAQPAAGEESDIAVVGDVLEFALPLIAFGSTVVKKDWQGSRQFLMGAGTNLAATYMLKETVPKWRPDRNDHDSFPSAHSSVTFHAARFVHKRYGARWAIPAYGLAGFVGYSRVEDDRHYEIDVVAGAALGMLAAEVFTSRYDGLRFEPVLGEYNGLRVTYRW